MTQKKPILCLDFDGVIHSYESGWKGADIIPDPPVPGAIEFIERATQHFTVMIFSSRSHQPGGINAMRAWLAREVVKVTEVPNAQNLEWFWEIGWPEHKPPAFLTIDDRALRFTGKWPVAAELLDF